jgi:transcriptional regulator GlxA family with amidase domain
MKFSRHRVLIVGLPPAQMLDVTGPLEVFAMANRCCELAGAPAPYEIGLAGPRAGALATSSGVALLAPQGLDGSPRGVDTLLVAGGAGAREAVKDPALVARLAAACARVPRVGSICTGAFALAATGLLDGRRATTHWMHAPMLARQFPRVTVEPDRLYIEDGPILTSAGSAAAIDMFLHLIRREHGAEIANSVARRMVVPAHRSGGQSQYIETSVPQSGHPDEFAQTLQWAQQHLGESITVDALAARAAMSPRTFARRFSQQMGTTPGFWLTRQRVILAERLLERGDQTIAAIAARCGLGSADTLRRHFSRVRGTTPAQYRRAFRLTEHEAGTSTHEDGGRGL